MKRETVIKLIVLISIIGFGVFMVPSFIVEPAYATTYTDLYYSQPTAQTISVITVTNPANARDLNNATFASFDYGTSAAGYFQVGTFKNQLVKPAPLPVITQVDLKLRYSAAANPSGETYQIDYLVSPSVALQSLQAATGSAYALNTRVWSAVSEPNNGVWDWNDIANLKIRVTTSGTSGGTTSSLFQEYEAWATVTIKNAARLFVDPANVTNTAYGVGSTFTVYVKLENISSSAGTEFKLRYDPRVLNVTSTVPSTAAGGQETLPADFIYAIGTIWGYDVDRTHGIIWSSYTAGPISPAPAPSFGSGKVMQINFKVIGLGLTTLKLYDSVQGKPGGAPLSCDLTNGYFRNVAMPYGATVKALVGGAQPKNTTFLVDINITKGAGQSGAFGLYSFQFNMTYNTSYLTATDATEGEFLKSIGSTFDKTINDVKGWILLNSTLNGDLAGAWGNGTLARISFDIDSGAGAGAISPLNFVTCRLTRLDYGLAEPFPASVSWTAPFYQLPVTTVNGSVNVKYVPHDVAVTAATPEATQAYKGYARDISATVTNQGGWNETFDVMAYYNSSKLNVNGYSATFSGWTKTGSAPYLGAADYATNYISTSTAGDKIGDFSFPDVPSYGQTLAGVKLYLKAWSAVDDGLVIQMWDSVASTWIFFTVSPTSHAAPGSYLAIDLFSQINTWNQVNGTKMEIQMISVGATDSVGVDHAYIVTESQIGTTQHVADLKAGNSRVLTFTWTTTNVPYGYYEVKVEASKIYKETDLADNVGSGGIVMMTIPGDVNGDKTVNVFDILAVKSRWGRTPASPDWIPEYDANVDDAINVFDILTVKANWGQSW